jgi:hypothetical protein
MYDEVTTFAQLNNETAKCTVESLLALAKVTPLPFSRWKL